jgi:hypothetical protein
LGRGGVCLEIPFCFYGCLGSFFIWSERDTGSSVWVSGRGSFQLVYAFCFFLTVSPDFDHTLGYVTVKPFLCVRYKRFFKSYYTRRTSQSISTLTWRGIYYSTTLLYYTYSLSPFLRRTLPRSHWPLPFFFFFLFFFSCLKFMIYSSTSACLF